MTKTTKVALAIGGLAAGVAVIATAAPFAHARQDEKSGRKLVLFFSPDAPLDPKVIDDARSLEKIALRWVLLIPDYGALTRGPSKEFGDLVNAVRTNDGDSFSGLALHDAEGLGLAERFGVARLPAVVLVAGGRAHVAYGRRPNIKELAKCAR